MQRVRPYRCKNEKAFTRRTRSFFAWVIVGLLAIVPLVPVNGNVAKFTRFIFSYWTVADRDFGKLKFVSIQDGGSAPVSFGTVVEFYSPFSASVLEKTKTGETLIIGNSDLFKAVAPGIVESVKKAGKDRIITIDHGNNIKSIYQFEGLFCVKNNDRVDGDFIGIAKNKQVILTITSSDRVLEIVKIDEQRLDVNL